ncbi:MAG: metallophosphoesterase family protein [Ruminococcus sp.]|nr:metallophosphoesterase family protein [Ruminococcus sp.]
MRIAALGDIHSNHFALEACLKWIDENDIDGIAFLGDYISDCPYPQKTMHILRNISPNYMTWFVRGNREDYMLEHKRNITENWSYGSQTGSLLYTYNELLGSDLRFFEDMPIGMEVKIDGYPPFSICHASMQSSSELFTDESEIIEHVLDEMTTSMLLYGHCHKQYIHTRRTKTIVNTGVVGISANGQTNAQLAVIESDGGDWTPTLINVPYDRNKVIDEFSESGLLDKANVWSRSIIANLKSGRHYNNECVKLVEKIAKERELDFNDESIWQEAANILGI